MKYSILLALSLAGLLSCSKPVAGTATDTENTVAGIVVDANGKPVANVDVQLVIDSLSLQSQTVLAKTAQFHRLATTNEKGEYQFTQVDSQLVFSLSFLSKDSQITQTALLRNLRLAKKESEEFRRVQLAPSQTLTGVVVLDNSTGSVAKFDSTFRITIVGSGFYVQAKAGETFQIPNVPAGLLHIAVYPANTEWMDALIAQGIPRDSLITRILWDSEEQSQTQLPDIHWSFPYTYRCMTQQGLAKCMSGVVVNYLDDPVEGVEVRVVLDSLGFSYLEGFEGNDSIATMTSIDGSWILPFPHSESFHLEFHKKNKQDSLVGCANLAIKSSLSSVGIYDVDTVQIMSPSKLKGTLLYTEEPQAWISLGSHFRVGIKGTTRYMDVFIGQPFELTGLPMGKQSLVEYPRDTYLWPSFEAKLGSLESMTQSTEFVVLTPGVTLEQQVETYTLPTP